MGQNTLFVILVHLLSVLVLQRTQVKIVSCQEHKRTTKKRKDDSLRFLYLNYFAFWA